MLETGAAELAAATDVDAQTEPTYLDHAIEDAIQQSSGAQVPPLTPCVQGVERVQR